MDIKLFSILSMVAVPIAMTMLLALAAKVVPHRFTKSVPFQTFATLWLLAIFAVPVGSMYYDSQGQFFEDRYALVRGGLGLPNNVEIPGKRFSSLGDCWTNSVDWSLDTRFPSPERLELYFEQQPYREPLVEQISAYFNTPMDQITVLDGALDPREIDEKWMTDLDEPMREWWQYRRRSYFEPSVCLAIERPDKSNAALTLRPCDPVILPEDEGNMGRVILHRSAGSRTLEGHIHYATGPAYCTNPVRRAVNNALGLPHPEARRAEDGTTLPRQTFD